MREIICSKLEKGKDKYSEKKNNCELYNYAVFIYNKKNCGNLLYLRMTLISGHCHLTCESAISPILNKSSLTERKKNIYILIFILLYYSGWAICWNNFKISVVINYKFFTHVKSKRMEDERSPPQSPSGPSSSCYVVPVFPKTLESPAESSVFGIQ